MGVMVKLSDLPTATEVHKRCMHDPAYRRAYYRAWLPAQVSLLTLRIRVWLRPGRLKQ